MENAEKSRLRERRGESQVGMVVRKVQVNERRPGVYWVSLVPANQFTSPGYPPGYPPTKAQVLPGAAVTALVSISTPTLKRTGVPKYRYLLVTGRNIRAQVKEGTVR